MLRVATALVCIALPAALPAAGSAGDPPALATARITAVVKDSVGVALAPDGSYRGSVGTARATVTRERLGDRLVVTVVAQ